MGFRQLFRLTVVGCYTLLWLGGVYTYLVLGRPPDHARWTAPVFLILSAILAWAVSPPKARLFLIAAGAIGFGAEYAGVTWGLPFGVYQYTAALGPKWLGVPRAMAAA